jgi:hypothetical protein
MSDLSKDQQRRFVQTWQKAGPELEQLRREQLRDLPYRWQDVDCLLELGDHYDGPARATSGLVEMQRWFMKFARQQGRLEQAVGESPAEYQTKPSPSLPEP